MGLLVFLNVVLTLNALFSTRGDFYHIESTITYY
jgi:hypothetical protein